MLFDEEQNNKNISEAWVISFLAKLYQAGQNTSVFRKEFESRVINPQNKLIFRALLGEPVIFPPETQQRFKLLLEVNSPGHKS
jgi:hypothetical protein